MSNRLQRVGVPLVAAAYLGYWALLLSCDLFRPAPFGMGLIDRDHIVIREVVSGGQADKAGLKVGDRIAAVDGHLIRDRMDWMAVEANLTLGQALELTVDSSGAPVRAALVPQPASWESWRSGHGPTLVAVRGMQLATLLLAVVIAMKRPGDPAALVGAAFLATIGVFSLALPPRFASVWRTLPLAVQAPLLVPFMGTVAIAPWGFSFFALLLRRRVRRPWVWAALWLPMAPGLIGQATFGYHVMVLGRPAPTDLPWIESLLVVGIAYVGGAIWVVARDYGRLSDINERRRVRVVVFGSLIGVIAGTPVVLWYWRSATGSVGDTILASPLTALGTLLFLVLPLSFAYAILRHRLFDISMIIRQGVRYGLARRAMLAVAPVLVVAAVLDLIAHGDQPVASVLRSHAWAYAVLVGLAVVARSQREAWLEALDRRFFRERYNAQRLLRQVAEDVRQAPDLASTAPTLALRIEQALHPTFAALLSRDGGRYRVRAAAPTASAATSELDAGNKVVALARLVGKPLETSGTDTAWLARKLPVEDTQAIRTAGIDLIVPITSNSGDVPALFVLGPKRSEEPYTPDDAELLMAIAERVAERLSRDEPVAAATDEWFRDCPTCGRCYGSDVERCGHDGAKLATVPVPPVLANRYRLERRLGRGGMGTVYRALDTLLDRPVAAKLMREDLAELPGAIERFQREARLAAAFCHPNVVTVHDFGIAGTRVFLVMELLEGRTLRDVLRGEPHLEPRRVVAILRDVAAAVAAAHEQRMVHRDLKPENICLVAGPSGDVAKVLDFGLAKLLAPRDGDLITAQSTGGMLLGTPLYMSPEALRGEDPNPGWDVWALSVIGFELLTGTHPFMFELGGLGPARDWAADPRLAGLPRECGAFFARALALDAGLRPRSATVFFHDFADSLHA
ncbi:MAG: protein kinase domain-containing protein [Acidobacteriota bacterium]